MNRTEVLGIVNAARAAGQIPDLRGAKLRWADLSWADLRGAKLNEADLSWADLSGAKLNEANLRGAKLRGAKLRWADLSDTCLDPTSTVPPITDEQIVRGGLELMGERVYGWRTATSAHCGNTSYAPSSAPYVAPVFSVDVSTECHPGIYLASRDWLSSMYRGVEVVRCYCLRSELVNAGDKWRCKRLWVVDSKE